MNLKKWLVLAILLAALVIAYSWTSGIFRASSEAISPTYVSPRVPAPGPGQNKVVLQNLGMT